MQRIFLFCSAVWLMLVATAAGEDKETSSLDFSVFPTMVLISAVGQEPAQYAYWKADINQYLRNYAWSGIAYGYSSYGYQEESYGTGMPVVSTWVNGAGYRSTTFRFYNDQDRLLDSVTARVYVDENGFATDEPYGYGWDNSYSGWHYYRGSYYRGSYYREAADKANSLEPVNHPWPSVELLGTVSGNGPWTVTLQPQLNLPDEMVERYEWDYNHDGVFNFSSGRTASRSIELQSAGRYIFSVRVTDVRGYTTTAECSVTAGT